MIKEEKGTVKEISLHVGHTNSPFYSSKDVKHLLGFQARHSHDFGNVGPKLDYPIFFLTMKKYNKIWSVID